MEPKIWALRAGSGKRFRSGHPWVFSNELAGSPKGVEPGALVELRDEGGNFQAKGFGNPNSLIAFRALSRNIEDKDPGSSEFIFNTLFKAHRLREICGLKSVSHRLFFGEADGVPGLVIDHYLTDVHRVFVVQAQTAGADRILPKLPEILERFTSTTDGPNWDNAAIVVRSDASVRKLEGLAREEPRAIKHCPGLELEKASIVVASACGKAPLKFFVNLLGGQKTGFFLDQHANIGIATTLLGSMSSSSDGSPSTSAENASGDGRHIRILDLFSYVGQWGAQFSRAYGDHGVKAQVTCVDSSEAALGFARENVELHGGACETLREDVMEGLGVLGVRRFDIVVCDPPALIGSRKDIGAGARAYMKLNAIALRFVRDGGALITCSCSSLLGEEDFVHALNRATGRAEVTLKLIGRGSHSPDHPVLSEFPEGRYLKCWVGIVNARSSI